MSRSRAPFLDRLNERRAATGATLCVGLDPDPDQIPLAFGSGVEGVRRFLSSVIDATKHVATAYKPNSAFFEALGRSGWEQLADTIADARQHAPVILDAKRGDIGNTSRFYARAAFEGLNADALTINPLLGADSLAPYLEYTDRGVFVLCATSNPGADDFLFPGQFHERVMRYWERWSAAHPAVGLVVGATRPQLLRGIAEACASAPLLIPGIGTQGGDVATSAALAASRATPALINITRAIIYPETKIPPDEVAVLDFTEAIHRAATSWHRQLPVRT